MPYKNISFCIFREMSSLQVRSTIRPASHAAWELRQEVATHIAKIKRLKENLEYAQRDNWRNDKMPLLLSLMLWDTRHGG